MKPGDDEIRAAVFAWLDEESGRNGGLFQWAALTGGLRLRNGQRLPLVAQSGIWCPKICDVALSIRTAAPKPNRPPPYEDTFTDGRLHYRYRGDDPDAWDNRSLREAMARRKPLVWFVGVRPGVYIAEWPVVVVADDPATLSFEIELVRGLDLPREPAAAEGSEAIRRYVSVARYARLHQRAFRERVLAAYHEQCAFCRLRHRELLDAAHIVPDADGGQPVVPNGLALCKLHHAAFDGLFVGVHPDRRIVVVRRDVREEEDGPMLEHGLKRLHGKRIHQPRSRVARPRHEFLETRFRRFRAVRLAS